MDKNVNSELSEISMEEILLIEGGSTKVAAAVFTIGAGVCFVASGVCSLTGDDDAAAKWGIAGGTCGAIAGACTLAPLL